MGLDCYWMFDYEQVSDGDFSEIDDFDAEEEDSVWSGVAREADASIVPSFDRELDESVAVGMVVGGRAPDSFRGKVYHPLINDLTGISIRQDLTNEQVTAVADELETVSWDELPSQHKRFFDSKTEWREFRLMWRRFADAGAWMHAWY